MLQKRLSWRSPQETATKMLVDFLLQVLPAVPVFLALELQQLLMQGTFS